jgi:hypothetical protein
MRLLAPVLLGVLALTAGGPSNSSRPLVTGTLQVGSRLSAAPGSWSGTGTIRYAYQWYRCDQLGAHCSSIHGATKGTYRIVALDARRTLALTVRGTDPTGTSSAYAALAGVVSPAAARIAPTKQPPLQGDPVVGKELTAGTTGFTAHVGTLSYAWLRCNVNGRLCSRIAGAAGGSYTPTGDDVGHVLVATATFGRRTVLSLGAGPVRARPGPFAVMPPSVTGALRQGSKLTASAGVWSGTGTITYGYQWYRCDALGAHCSAVRGATRGSYTEVGRDVGKTIGVAVRATDPTGTTVAYAPLAGPVAAPGGLAALAQPTVAGTAAVGRTLTIRAGRWSEEPTSFAYAWLRCNGNGRVCAAIGGATAATYTPTADDAGHTVAATVTATAGTATAAVLAVASAVVAS